MGLEYYHSMKEKEHLQKRITKQNYHIFNDDHVDENGNSTDNNHGRIMFGSKKLNENGINHVFYPISGHFELSVINIRNINKYFPIFYRQHEDKLTEKLCEELKIKNQNDFESKMRDLEDKGHSTQSNTFFNTLSNMFILDSFYDSGKFNQQLNEELTQTRMYLPEIPKFLREMSLIYLVASFYGFVKKIFEKTFSLNNELLQTFETKFSYEEISNLQKNELYEKMIDEVSSDITRGIDNITKAFNKFQLYLKKDSEWEKFYGIILTRNILVHNNGIPDKKYQNHFAEYNDIKIEISESELDSALDLFLKFHKIIWEFFWERYVKPLWLKQLEENDRLI